MTDDNDEKAAVPTETTPTAAAAAAAPPAAPATVTPTPQKAPPPPPLATGISTTDSGSGSGGFFSLGGSEGGSSIAERAQKLKEEAEEEKSKKQNQQDHHQQQQQNGNNDEEHSNNHDDHDNDHDHDDDLHLFDKLYVYNQNEEKDNAYFNSLVDGFKYLRKKREDATYDMIDDAVGDGGSSDKSSSTNMLTTPYCYATVNFIDPTTKNVVATSPTKAAATSQPKKESPQSAETPKPTNLLQQQSMLARAMSSASGSGSSVTATNNSSDSATAPAIENVYEKLTYIFQRDYQSTLRSVQYKNIRTGEKDVISSLPVHPILSRTGGATAAASTATSPTSHGGSGGGFNISSPAGNTNKGTLSALSPKNINLPWGGAGAASSAILPSSDAAEWHTGPFCHVYVAACENAEHYRTKIKPSLEVFVKQLESVAANTTAGRQQGGHSSEYLILYIPVGNASTSGMAAAATTDSSTSAGGGGTSSSTGGSAASKRSGSFGSRLQMARQRAFGHSSSTTGTDDEDNDSRGSLGSDPELSGSGDSGDDLDSGASVALHLLSRQERSLFKRIAADFPNGKVCVLSTVSLDRSDENMDNSDGVATRTQEWNTFNRMLGSVVVNGFKDRCRRYKDELKRLDAQRATAATAAKGHHGRGKPNPYAFNLCHFFLVKESLAFSFEQMQLPAETLLQYDEFRLYMPDLSDKEERQVRRSRRKSKALFDIEGSEPALTAMADTGDSVGFRKRIRSEFDLTPILDIMRRYLFAREMTLLFRMEQPVELLTRVQSFVKTMYSIMLRGLSELSDEEQKERKNNATKWVVQFIWDVKRASDFYFATGDDHSDNISVDTMTSAIGKEAVDKIVASKISDLLEISRLMLLRLGDTELVGGNPLREIQQNHPDDLKHPWTPWTALDSDIKDDDKRASWKPSMARLSVSTCNSTESELAQRHFILSTALATPEEFEQTYHDLCLGMVKTSLKAKRRRYAARLEAEMGEFYLRKGDKASAAASFKKILKVYKQDQWDRLHFWRLFRLAYCQRTMAEPSDYLKTLVSCFTPRLTASAPAKTLSILQDDLEAVLAHPSIADARYGKLAFIETHMTLPNASKDFTSIGDGVDKKQVVKKFCDVGETLQIKFAVTSHLPKMITTDSIQLFVLPFGDFASILEKGDAIEEEDAAKVLALESPLKIQPGKNEFEFEWTPPASGQYILSTVELKWLQGYFYYDSMDLPHPMLGVDVLPSEPTHSISLEPRYLNYGHDQEVQMTFDAGSDTITSGKAVLSCSDGLLILPEGQDLNTGEWTQKFEMDLNTSSPGDKYVVKVHVRTDKNKEPHPEPDSADGAKGLSAKAFTTYLNANTVDSGESANANAMKTVLESFVPLLEKSALSVESVQYHWVEEDTVALICILLKSNSPNPFSIPGWDLTLPTTLRLGNDGDLNGHIRDSVVSTGDLISFSFECHVGKDVDETEKDDLCTLSVRVAEESGDPFVLDLPVDIASLYSSLELDQTVSGDAILATLTVDANEGIVGEPVTMKYSLNIPSSETLSKLDMVYSFDQKDSTSSWALAGKTSGLVTPSSAQTKEFTCKVVGIPAVTGFLDDFPQISLSVVRPEGGEKMPILVETKSPSQFLSRPPKEPVTTVGYRSTM